MAMVATGVGGPAGLFLMWHGMDVASTGVVEAATHGEQTRELLTVRILKGVYGLSQEDAERMDIAATLVAGGQGLSRVPGRAAEAAGPKLRGAGGPLREVEGGVPGKLETPLGKVQPAPEKPPSRPGNGIDSQCFVEGTLIWVPWGEEGALLPLVCPALPTEMPVASAEGVVALAAATWWQQPQARWLVAVLAVLVGVGGGWQLHAGRGSRRVRPAVAAGTAGGGEPPEEPEEPAGAAQPEASEESELESVEAAACPPVEEEAMGAEVVTAAQGKASVRRRRSRVRQAASWCSVLGGLVLATCLTWGLPLRTSPSREPAAAAPVAVVPALPAAQQPAAASRRDEPAHGLRRIETIRVGQRVLGRNPQGAAAREAEPEAATWRQLELELRKANGRLLQAVLLRPVVWLEERQARVGGLLWLDLPRMGACGWAEVKAIRRCPEIEAGPGSVVTATFRHEPDDNVLEVRLEGQAEPIGVTDTHPWWSEDRQAFVAVGQLRVGERVRTAKSGVVRIAAVEHRPRTAWVYNLEVHGEHVYQVSALGVLVHNDNILPPLMEPPGGARVQTPVDRGGLPTPVDRGGLQPPRIPQGNSLAPAGSRVVLNALGGTQTAPARFVRTVQPGERIADLIAEGRAATWVEEAEHAVISLERTGPGRIQRVVVSGGRDGIEFIERGGNLFIEMDGQLVQVRRVIGHTHPRVTGPSQGDLDALRMLGQTRSYIIEIGGEPGGTLIRPR
jgi:hypothetical protein